MSRFQEMWAMWLFDLFFQQLLFFVNTVQLLGDQWG